MMQMTEHRPGAHHYVRRVAETELTIDDTVYRSSLILGARLLHSDWPVSQLDQLQEATVAPLLEHQPELVLIGCGLRPGLLPPRIQRLFLERGIGLECMSLAAACRTFNILMSENRRAIAGLILPTAPGSRQPSGDIPHD